MVSESYQSQRTEEVDVIQLLPLVDRGIGHFLDWLKRSMVDDDSVDLAAELHSKVCDLGSILEYIYVNNPSGDVKHHPILSCIYKKQSYLKVGQISSQVFDL